MSTVGGAGGAYDDDKVVDPDKLEDFGKRLFTKYDHDFSTYHVGNRLNQKKRISPLVLKSRKAPFALAELSSRKIEKHLATINVQKAKTTHKPSVKSGQITIENSMENFELELSVVTSRKASEISGRETPYLLNNGAAN